MPKRIRRENLRKEKAPNVTFGAFFMRREAA